MFFLADKYPINRFHWFHSANEDTNFVSDNKILFENTYCNCTTDNNRLPWCERWSSQINSLYCVLNGGIMSRSCPGATRLGINGRLVNEFFSSDSSICKRAERRSFITVLNYVSIFQLFMYYDPLFFPFYPTICKRRAARKSNIILSIQLLIYLFTVLIIYLFHYLFIYSFVYLSMYLFFNLLILFIHLFIYLFNYLFIYLFIWLFLT